MLELQSQLESKAAKWYSTNVIANALFSIPIAPECGPHFACSWRSVWYTWNQLPQRCKYSFFFCHGPTQTAPEQSEAPEHLQYVDDSIMWSNIAEVFRKEKKTVWILLKADFVIR